MNLHEENFEKLQKLLNWKRHEQPPPGYFNSFADRVIARLEAEHAVPVSWWLRWFASFDAKPVLACAYGVSVGVLLLFGLGFAQVFENEPPNMAALKPANNSLWLAAAPMPSVIAPASLAESQLVIPAAPSSINPVVHSAPPGSLFDGSGLKVEAASFKLR